MKSFKVSIAALAAAAVLASCGGSGSGSGSPTPSTRPSSPAHLTILSPRNGQVVHGSVRVRFSLRGAKIVKPRP